MKLKLILGLALVLSGGLSAYADSMIFPVTPTNLDQGQFVFSISTNSTPAGISFHVTITAKTGVIFPDSQADLSTVTRTPNSGTIQPVKSVTLKKNDHYWTADFIATPELLKTPDLCFVFTAYCHATENGKSILMDCADFYKVKLQDFLKP
jgi:hypothetical protein